MINLKSYKLRDEFVINHSLPMSYKDSINNYLFELVMRVNYWINCKNTPICIGINGAQGTGKSTMASFIKFYLEEMYKLNVVVVSIDDLYKTRKDREKLSLDVHQLFQTRGVPGTHDIDTGFSFINSCINEEFKEIKCPRFDKRNDDRMPIENWINVDKKVDLVILEGWCVGTRPQPKSYLSSPINDFERINDSDGIWRNYSNNQLFEYQKLFKLCSYLIMLNPPNFEIIYDWKLKQEIGLDIKSNKKLIINFVDHFERLTRWTLDDLPSQADILIQLDINHNINKMNFK